MVSPSSRRLGCSASSTASAPPTRSIAATRRACARAERDGDVAGAGLLRLLGLRRAPAGGGGLAGRLGAAAGASASPGAAGASGGLGLGGRRRSARAAASAACSALRSSESLAKNVRRWRSAAVRRRRRGRWAGAEGLSRGCAWADTLPAGAAAGCASAAAGASAGASAWPRGLGARAAGCASAAGRRPRWRLRRAARRGRGLGGGLRSAAGCGVSAAALGCGGLGLGRGGLRLRVGSGAAGAAAAGAVPGWARAGVPRRRPAVPAWAPARAALGAGCGSGAAGFLGGRRGRLRGRALLDCRRGRVGSLVGQAAWARGPRGGACRSSCRSLRWQE